MIGCDRRNVEPSVAVPWAGPTRAIPPPLPSYLNTHPPTHLRLTDHRAGPTGQLAAKRKKGLGRPDPKNQTGQPVVRVPFDRTEATQAVGSTASPVRLVGVSEAVVASIRGKAWAFIFLEIRAGIIGDRRIDGALSTAHK
ncbi:hypothetical protein BHE74_00007006 [Ensete ventricosum]|uniref:Uncharacterized protein n=1 Tax=Ensete ventricosum TaxID=4639 RepID=A0A444D7W1_ENSVE|nr:hypothetical protein GW17_00043283 [Ensete ventricosum]RWW84393.1 hypothetical protein BHE74_00007006 [Ensete ventricosum]RZR70480.1 hypothetical protein BHM03_00000089 [Ensete ventricosum]